MQEAGTVFCFCFSLFKVAVGFFGLCVSFVQKLSQMRTHPVTFSPRQFLCILLLEERGIQVQALQHYSKGFKVPGLSHSFYWQTKEIEVKVAEILRSDYETAQRQQ